MIVKEELFTRAAITGYEETRDPGYLYGCSLKTHAALLLFS
jgi:hypothetical protein